MKGFLRIVGTVAILALLSASSAWAQYVDAYSSASETRAMLYTLTCDVLAIEEVSNSVKLGTVMP